MPISQLMTIFAQVMDDLLQALFQSRTRTALLRLFFVDGVSDSLSGLARRARLSQHSVAVEVKNLARTGLIKIESVGASDLVRANATHPAAKPLAKLLRVPNMVPGATAEETGVKETLAAYGAPLLSYKPHRHMPLEKAMVKALRLAKHEASLLKVLPVVLARNAQSLNWVALKENARRAKLKAELGMLVELTADLAGRPHLKEKVRDLADRRRKVESFFYQPRSKYERELARTATPAAARKWGFLMNLGEDTLRSTMVKHLAQRPS